MKAILTSFLILIIGTSCCSTPPTDPLPCPPRPVLEAITVEEQLAIAPDVVLKIASNQIKLKEYAKKLEVRAECEGE